MNVVKKKDLSLIKKNEKNHKKIHYFPNMNICFSNIL